MYRYPTNILLFDVIDSSGVIARDRGATKASRGVSHKVGLFKRKISDWEIDLQQIIESYSNCAAGIYRFDSINFNNYPSITKRANASSQLTGRRNQGRSAFDSRGFFTEYARNQNIPHYIPHFSKTLQDDIDVCAANFLENTGLCYGSRNFKTCHLDLLINRFRVQVPAGAPRVTLLGAKGRLDHRNASGTNARGP